MKFEKINQTDDELNFSEYNLREYVYQVKLIMYTK